MNFKAGDTIKFLVPHDPFESYKDNFTVIKVHSQIPFIGFRAVLKDAKGNKLLFIPKIRMIGDFCYPESFSIDVVISAPFEQQEKKVTFSPQTELKRKSLRFSIPNLKRANEIGEVFRSSI